MIINYIDVEGNIKELNCIDVPSHIEKIGINYFEKKIVEVKKEKEVKVKEEVKEEIKEEVKEEKEINEDVIERAKEFCKEKKIRGFGLLKGDNLIKKAVENGFII